MIKLCLTHLEVWAGCICGEEELLQVGGMSVPSCCSQGRAWAAADFGFSTQSLFGRSWDGSDAWLACLGWDHLLDVSAAPLSLGCIQAALSSAFSSSCQKFALL